MRPFLQLTLKEARQALGTALVFTGILLAALLYLISRLGIWPTGLVALFISLLMGFVPFWALWRTYYSLRQEWTGDHMYLLLSLPVPGWYITGSKLIVALLEMLLYTALLSGAALVVFFAGGGDLYVPSSLISEPVFIATTLRVALLSLAVLFIGMIVVQFSHLASRLVSRFRGPLMIALVLVSTWVVTRGAGLLAPILSWLPEVPVHSIEFHDDFVSVATVYLGVAPLAGALIVSLGLFWLGSYLLERDVEL